jgi:hypothetical protein
MESIKKDFGARKVKRKGGRIWWMFLGIVLAVFIIGYIKEYKPRTKVKNYGSYAILTVRGVEMKLESFEAAGKDEREKIINSLSHLWGDFCLIECPDHPLSDQIQWKMAKLFEYTKIFMERELQGRYIGYERDDALIIIIDRIKNLKRLSNDAIAYGNFKRLK